MGTGQSSCPSGQNCVNRVCVSPTTPSITVTSPNGGETWRVGETRDITWQSNGIDRAYIMLYGHSSSGGVVYWSQIPGTSSEGVPGANGRVSWTIPSDFLARSQNASKFSVRISSCLTCYTQQFFDDSNGYFTIAAANPSDCLSGWYYDQVLNMCRGKNFCGSTQATIDSLGYYRTSEACRAATTPSITVTSPNGGETWRVGETRTIRWSLNGGSFDGLYISLNQVVNAAVPTATPQYTIARLDRAQANLGYYNWTIPST